MRINKLVNAILNPLGLELQRNATHEEKPWDHTFRQGIRAENEGGDPNVAVTDAWGKPKWAKYIIPHLHNNMTVCEIGPGVGRWTKYVIDRSSQLYLADYSKVVCDYWRSKQDNRIEVIQSQNTRLPQIPDASIDLFMSFDVFVHMDIEIFFGYLEEAFRILKPSGVAVIDYLSIDDGYKAQWFINEIRKQDTYGSSHEVKRSIFRTHHKETIKVLAETIGFSVENVEDEWRMHNICTLRKHP